MSTCNRAEDLRDYAFEELAGGDRRAMEQHISGCAECASELDQLRVTTAALRALPDREIPQRIAFVSDKVFSPSPVARFFGAFWNSAARLGFVSACAISAALIFSAYRRPVEVRTAVQTSSTAASTDVSPQSDVSHQIDFSDQINDAVARAVTRVRAEDAQSTKALLANLARDRQQDRKEFIEMVTVIQNRANTNTLLASYDRPGGPGQ